MRPRINWLIAGVVVAVGVLAALDALRSVGGEPPPAETSATEAATTTQPESATQAVTATQTEDAVVAEALQLRTRRLVRLIPGRVTTNSDFPIVVRFTVPAGWYGYQDRRSFVIGKSRSLPLAAAGNVSLGGIAVGILDHGLPYVLKDLEVTAGIRVRDVSLVRIGGYAGRRFGVVVRRPPAREVLGVPGEFLDESDEQLILLGVGRRTLLIRPGSDGGDPERFEVDRVLGSFRLTTPEQQIERTGSRWARLFAAGRSCNRLMHQPACERVFCMRPGGAAIQNCTPVSSEVQRSFAGAVVADIVIRGEWAVARFSNGETVRFREKDPGRSWWIDRVGAGRHVFE